MRQNKWAILITFPLTVVALILASFFDNVGYAFWSNVFLGVFGSGLLTAMVAAINYSTERRKTLEAFWSFGHKAIKNINRYSPDDDLDTTIDILLQMNEFDYQPFDDAYGDICFIFNNKKLRKEITERIYGPLLELRHLITEKSFHFNLYKKAENGNKIVMQHFVDEIDQLLVERKEHHYPQENGETFTVKDVSTYKVQNLLTEFNDYYYFVMYPWRKKEAAKNAD